MSSTTETLRQVFPHLSEDTIESVVEGLRPNFVDHPERLLDRATSELLRGNFPVKKKKAVEDLTNDQDVAHIVAAPKAARDLEAEKLETLQFVEDLAPNVDMNWLSKHYDTFVLNGEHALRSKDRIQELLANYILEHSDYPKKPSTTVKAASFTPVDYSKHDDAITSADYRTNCLDQIQQDFRWVTLPSLREVLQRYGYHYFPTYTFLKRDLAIDGGGKPKSESGLKMLSKERVAREAELYDAEFVTEYEFTHREEVQKREEEQKKIEQQLRDEEDEKAGNVFECGCCFVDVPLSRMVQCAEGHLFCSDCIKKYVEEAVYASGQTTVHCLDQSGCKANFPMAQLERAVPAHQLQKIFARLADLDIKKAGLENIHQCPHCDYQMEISNPDEKLFVCRNPECGMETCLLCKEPNHIPLRCEEVEKKDVTDYRKKVEEAMTESLIRTCPKCKSKFFKAEGCNKMTCSCGAYVCYVCRMLITHKDGYSHFCSHDRNPREFGKCAECGKCFLFLKNTEQADQQLVEQAKAAATEQFAGDNVELAAVKVGADELKNGKNKKKKAKQPAHLHHQAHPLGMFGNVAPFPAAAMHQAFHQQIMHHHNAAQQMAIQAMQRLGDGMRALGGMVGLPVQQRPKVAGIAVDHRGQARQPAGAAAVAAAAAAAAPVVNRPAARNVVLVDELPPAARRPKRRVTGEPIVLDDDDDGVVPVHAPLNFGFDRRGGNLPYIAARAAYPEEEEEDEEDEDFIGDDSDLEEIYHDEYEEEDPEDDEYGQDRYY